ncbi:MAG: PAS domain-containing protein [Flavobacteriales bacterium]|jgi:hypothetical protein
MAQKTPPPHQRAEALITPEITRLLDAQNISVLIEDLERRVLLVNPAFCELFELQVVPEDMLYRDCSDELQQACLMFEDPFVFVQFVESALASRERSSSRPLPTKMGFSMEVTYVPLFTGGLLGGHLWFHQKLPA